MIVGFMRNNPKPFGFVRLLAKTSKYNDIDLVYFCPRDIDIKRKKVNGKFLIENKWVSKEIDIPSFIDASPYSFKYKKVIRFLKENTIISTDSIGSKDETYVKLEEDGDFSHLLIPTGKHVHFNDFLDFINKHDKVVVKPRDGLRGRGISMIEKKWNKYKVSYQRDEQTVNKTELEKLYNESWGPENFILQKYVISRTLAGEPFDCRIRLEKNGRGTWAVAIYLVRIGSNQKVVSNVAQGGSVTSLKPFLEANFPDVEAQIRESIKEIAKSLPYKIESLYNVDLSSLGLDIGIDRSGKLYLFEVENGPGFEFGEGRVASLKSEYYKYITNKINTSS